MSYSAAPTVSTDQNKTVNLFYGWDIRGDGTGTTDTVFKNALVEPMESKDYVQILKRNGAQGAGPGNFLTGLTAMVGIFMWNQPSGVQWFVAVWIDGSSVPHISVWTDPTNITAAPTFTATLTGTSPGDLPVYFQEFLYQSTAIDLLFSLGALTYKLTSAFALTTITGVGNAPAGGPLVYLDGYMFSISGQNINNSNLNDPTTWSAANFLAADSYPDNILDLARVGPYLVAFGSASIQYFYDAANPTGTPLGANVGATKHIGYMGGLASNGDTLYFIGKEGDGAPMLYQMDGLKAQPIASFQFSRVWSTNAPKNAASTATIAPRGSILILNAHTCYYVRTVSVPFAIPWNNPQPTGISYFYDLGTQVWSKLGYQQLDYFLINSAVQVYPSNGLPIMTYFTQLGLIGISRFNPTGGYTDSGVNFEVLFRTHPLTWGTSRHKFGSKLTVLGDMTSSTSFLNVSWSDDDYQTFSTPRPVDMSMQYQQLWSLGKFRKRAFQFSYSDNFPMRWQSFELDYQQGSD